MFDRNNNNSDFVRRIQKTANRAVMKTMMLSLAFVFGLASSVTAFPKGKLLVRSYNGSDWDLYVMNEDGSGLQSIDVSSSGIGNSDFSPDGNSILYLSTIGDVCNVYHVPINGGTKALVYSTSGLPQISAPIWGDSPDHFYYTLTLGGTCGNRIREIHRRAIDGSYDDTIIKVSSGNLGLTDIKELLNRSVYNDNIPPGCWSPLGAIVTYDVDGTNRQELSVTIDGNSDGGAKISPDGEYILYTQGTSWHDPHNIYMTAYADSGMKIQVTNYSGNQCAHYPVWRDDDSFFYSLTSPFSATNDVLHYRVISTGADVVIPCSLPNCVPVDFHVISESTMVAVDIKPGSCPNPLNVTDKGILPVAVLGSEDFDVFNIDPASIRLEGVAPIRSSYEDVTTPVTNKTNDCDCTTKGADGYLDLVFKFDAQEIVASLGGVYDGDELLLTLTGEDFTGTPIEGIDCVLIITKNAK